MARLIICCFPPGGEDEMFRLRPPIETGESVAPKTAITLGQVQFFLHPGDDVVGSFRIRGGGRRRADAKPLRDGRLSGRFKEMEVKDGSDRQDQQYPGCGQDHPPDPMEG